MTLPSGTVTFLFTDIEGSTNLLHSLGDRYAENLARHSEILETTVETKGGEVVNTDGDSYFCVFREASDAVSAAVGIVLGLASHDWPTENEFKVRVGIHTGEGVLGGRDYIGIDIHRAARISAAGHGGQVLLSEESLEQTGGRLPEGVTTTDLGRFDLKDLPEPEHIYQLVIPDARTTFPALRTGATPPMPLPPLVVPAAPATTVPTSGRAGILASMSRGRLATVTAIGGLAAGLGIGWGAFAGTGCEPCAAGPDGPVGAPGASDVVATTVAISGGGDCSGDPITIRDEEMADGNWSHEIVLNDPEDNPWFILDGRVGQDQDGDRDLDTGLQPPSRWIWYAWDGNKDETGLPGNVSIRHTYTGAQIPGEIDSLTINFDAWGGSVLVTPVLIQGGEAYAVQGLVTGGADSHPYRSECLTASDFTLGPGQPDFSQPMMFGYATASTSHFAEGKRDLRVVAVDNFTVEYWPSS